jgi:hypothetical protein
MLRSTGILCISFFAVIYSFIPQQQVKVPISHLYSTRYESSKDRIGRGSGGSGRGGGRGGRGGRGAPKQDYRNKNSVGTTRKKRDDGEGYDNTWMPISTKWRLFNIDVLLENDPGKDMYGVHEHLINSIQKSLGILIDTKKYLSSTNGVSSKGIWNQDNEDINAKVPKIKSTSNPEDDANTDR